MSFNAVSLLRHVLTLTGETEVNADGQTMPSRRRLNVRESRERSAFLSSTKEFHNNISTEIRAAWQAHQELVQGRRDEISDEKLLLADKQVLESYAAYQDKIDIAAEQTTDVVLSGSIFKKYFELYGEEVGFEMRDDHVVQELHAVL